MMFGERRRQPACDPRAKVIVLAVLVGFGLVLSAALLGQELPSAALPENPLAGRSLFDSKQCHRCHGIRGEGPRLGPSLSEGRFKGSFLDLGAALWNHAPAMSATFERTGLPWPQLAPEEAAQLTAFLYFIDYLGRPGVAKDGQRVFERGGCSGCHVVGGGRARLGPDLAKLQRFASPLYVAQEIWNHGPIMFQRMRAAGLAPPNFQDGDLADLSAFIRQKAGPGPREPLLLAPGNPNLGRRLFTQKGCSSCHGADGRGGRGGPDLGEFELQRPAEAIAGLMWNHALAMNDAMRARGIGWPRFENSELADLVAFLYFIPFADAAGDAKRGASLFTQRSCAECHSGTADALGPDLSTWENAGSPAALVGALWNHAPVMKKAILAKGRPWPQLTGEDIRDLRAFLTARREPGSKAP